MIGAGMSAFYLPFNAGTVNVASQCYQMRLEEEGILKSDDFLQVERAATVWVADGAGEHRLVAYLSPSTVDVVKLEDTLRDNIPAFLVPYLFQPLHRMPLTPHGEVQTPFCLQKLFIVVDSTECGREK